MSFGEMKYALNSSLGTGHFKTLDNMVHEASTGSRKAVFFEDGVFTVPEGVKTLYITACGGGGSGAYSTGSNIAAGKAGTATIIGDLVTLLPGQGGAQYRGGAAGGPGGGAGGDDSAGTVKGFYGRPGIAGGGGKAPSYISLQGYLTCMAGTGGGGSLGGGGAGGKAASGSTFTRTPIGTLGGRSIFGNGQDDVDADASTYCSGGFGAGSGGVGNNRTACGGGGADAILGKAFEVTPGQEIQITVGVGGSGRNNINGYGADGGDGIVIIEW